MFADSAFANMSDSKSQGSHIGFLCENADALKALDFTKSWPMWWHSGRVRRRVRSTLAAEGYPVSEGVEHSMYLSAVISEIDVSPGTQRPSKGYRELPTPSIVLTASQGPHTTVPRTSAWGSTSVSLLSLSWCAG